MACLVGRKASFTRGESHGRSRTCGEDRACAIDPHFRAAGPALRQARRSNRGAARSRPTRRGARADTFLVFDTHWISNFGCHMNANARHRGVYTSHEAQQYPEHALRLSRRSRTRRRDRGRRPKHGLEVLAHKVQTLALEYGAIVPMHYMNEGGWAKRVSVAAPIFATLRRTAVWRGLCDGDPASDRKSRCSPPARCLTSSSRTIRSATVSGSRSAASSTTGGPARRRSLEGASLRRILPDAAGVFPPSAAGEALMADTHMIFGLLGWDKYAGETEILCPYFSFVRKRPDHL